jgi:hypothetical protein
MAEPTGQFDFSHQTDPMEAHDNTKMQNNAAPASPVSNAGTIPDPSVLAPDPLSQADTAKSAAVNNEAKNQNNAGQNNPYPSQNELWGTGAGGAALGIKSFKDWKNPKYSGPSAVSDKVRQLSDIDDQLDALKNKLPIYEQNHSNLLDRHQYWGSDQALHDNVPDELKRVPEPVSPEPVSEGAANWSKKFGASPAQANEVPSMKAAQQTIVPGLEQAVETQQRIMPSAGRVAASPLVGSPDTQAILAKRAADQSRAYDLAADLAEKQKALLKPHLDAASKQVTNTVSQINDLSSQKEALESSLKGASPLSKLTDWIPKPISSAIRSVEPVARLAGKVAGPLAAAMTPFEATHSLKEYGAGNYGESAQSGLGALSGLAALATPLVANPVGATALGATALGTGLYSAFMPEEHKQWIQKNMEPKSVMADYGKH